MARIEHGVRFLQAKKKSRQGSIAHAGRWNALDRKQGAITHAAKKGHQNERSTAGDGRPFLFRLQCALHIPHTVSCCWRARALGSECSIYVENQSKNNNKPALQGELIRDAKALHFKANECQGFPFFAERSRCKRVRGSFEALKSVSHVV